MKLKLASILVVAGLLSGCDLPTVVGEIAGSSVTPQVAEILVDAYGVVEASGTAYVNSCHALAGSKTPCNRVTEQKVYSDLRIYGKSRDAVVTLLQTNNGGPIPIANYSTLETVYQALKADLVAAGVPVSS
jgi:hypothetical protein